MKNVIAQGHNVSVYDGEEWAVRQSQDEKEIFDAIESVEEANISIRNAQMEKLGQAFILPYENDLETLCDYSDNLDGYEEDWMLFAVKSTFNF